MSIYKSLPATPKKAKDFKRHIFAACFVFAFMFTLSFLLTSHPGDTSAILSGFSAGNIINDYTMSNYNSMSEADIQAWLTSKNSCNNRDYSLYQRKSAQYNWKGYYWHWNDGHFVCLSEERFGNYANEIGSGETAAHIIWQAAQDYHINPQVLLVLLQKETGLITDTIPNTWDYNRATGYGCPDTAPCDTQYYGFKNQVRHAAELFHNVLIGEWSCGNYPAYQTVFVKYHPSYPDGSWVYIENRATGALYRYTPYQPNAAALAAGYGTGDYLSSYGNRNFYNYFTDWFGSTQTSPWMSFTSPRYFEITEDLTRINPYTEEPTGVTLAQGTILYYTSKALVNGNYWCYRTEHNTLNNIEACVPIQYLKEITLDYEDIPENEQYKVITPSAQKVIVNRKDSQGTAITTPLIRHFSKRAEFLGETYYFTDYNMANNTNIIYGFRADGLTSIDYTEDSSLRVITDENGAKFNLASASPIGSLNLGMQRNYKAKIVLDGVTYYQTEYDFNSGEAYGVKAEHLSNPYPSFVPFEQPRALKLKSDVDRINLSDQSVVDTLPAGYITYFSTKTYFNGEWYFRTQHNTINNFPYAIPASALTNV